MESVKKDYKKKMDTLKDGLRDSNDLAQSRIIGRQKELMLQLKYKPKKQQRTSRNWLEE